MRNGKDNRRKGGEEEQISKALSHVLRHSAVDEHLSIQPSGYVPLDQIIGFLKRKGLKNINQERIRQIVDNNDKKRFQIEERKHNVFIRATQGHSIKMVNTEDLLTQIVDPFLYPVVVHGTFSKFWGLIKAQGLKRMTRNHIHFAPGMPKEEGVVSGMRNSCDIIVQIDMALAMSDGIKFFISTNNVILTEGQYGVLSPKYFKRVLRKDGTLIQGRLQEPQKQQIQEKPQLNKKQSQQGWKSEKKEEKQE